LQYSDNIVVQVLVSGR